MRQIELDQVPAPCIPQKGFAPRPVAKAKSCRVDMQISSQECPQRPAADRKGIAAFAELIASPAIMFPSDHVRWPTTDSDNDRADPSGHRSAPPKCAPRPRRGPETPPEQAIGHGETYYRSATMGRHLCSEQTSSTAGRQDAYPLVRWSGDESVTHCLLRTTTTKGRTISFDSGQPFSIMSRIFPAIQPTSGDASSNFPKSRSATDRK